MSGRGVADRTGRVPTLLGMARAGGNALLGEQACLKGVERRSIGLLVLAEDAGNSTQKRFERRCERAGVALVRWGSKEHLGRALGVAPKAVVGVTERNLAREILGEIEKASERESGV